MKNIDPKSVLIGVLATALVIACTDSSKPTSIIPEAKAAAGVNDKWDDKQEWVVTTHSLADIPGHDHYNRLDAALKAYADRMWRKNGVGREAFAMDPSDGTVYFRKRIK